MKNLKSKIILSVAVAILLCTFSANAQDDVANQNAEFGIRFMPTFSAIKLKTSSGGSIHGDVTFGFGIGALLGFNISKHVGIQGEIIYSSIAQKTKEQNVERRINLRYINIPLLLSLNTGKSKAVNLNVVAGPQIGFNVGSSITISGTPDPNNPEAVLAVKKSDLGLAYGLGVDFGLNAARTFRLGLGYRGVLGLFDISDNSGTVVTDSYYVLDRTNVKTNSAYLGISLLF